MQAERITAAGREEGIGAGGLRATVWVVLTLGGVACALTLLFLGMRAVMDVGGFCAEGGPFEVRQRCPQGVPGIMIGSIWGGLILAFLYGGVVGRRKIPGLGGLVWPALFLSLGWDFFEYAVDPPGGGGLVWGWLVCGVVFALMGGLPLLAVAPAVVGNFLGLTPRPRARLAALQAAAVRRRKAARPAEMVSELERLDALHRSGALDDEEYEAAKRRVIEEEEPT